VVCGDCSLFWLCLAQASVLTCPCLHTCAGFCNQGQDLPETVFAESFESSWARRTCDSLQASCHTAAWSGFGMVEDYDGRGTTLASDMWKRTLATVNGDNDTHATRADNYWKFSSWVPDAVVINLGTNDGLGRRTELIPTFNATYLKLVLAAGEAYGDKTSFFLACGPMTNNYCDQVHWVIAKAKAAGVQAFFLDFVGLPHNCCGHPCAADDVVIGNFTAKTIAAQMGWDSVEIEQQVTDGLVETI